MNGLAAPASGEGPDRATGPGPHPGTNSIGEAVPTMAPEDLVDASSTAVTVGVLQGHRLSAG